MLTQSQSVSPSVSLGIQERIKVAAAALALGLVLLGGVGFAGASVLHNAAHDTRHAVGFPCH